MKIISRLDDLWEQLADASSELPSRLSTDRDNDHDDDDDLPYQSDPSLPDDEWRQSEDSYQREANDAEEMRIQADRFGDFDSIERPDSLPMEGESHYESLIKACDAFRHIVANRETSRLQQCWDEIAAHADALTDNPLDADLAGEISEVVEDLDSYSPKIIYAHTLIPEHSVIHVPKLVITVSRQLVEYIAKHPSMLRHMSPREFEEFIAEIFSGFGYMVELTARTRDGGRDIIAIKQEHDVQLKLLLECKRYSPDRKVGVSHVRELYAVKTIERATKAILATTSTFTADARAIEKQLIYELELKDFYAVTSWASEYTRILASIRR
jgi:HJR/Mrr/RecB family endonuclease